MRESQSAWMSGTRVFLIEGRASAKAGVFGVFGKQPGHEAGGVEWGVSCRRWGQRALEAIVRLLLWVWWGPNGQLKQNGDMFHLRPSYVMLAILGRPHRGPLQYLRKNEYTWLAGSCGGVNGLGKKWVDTRNAVMEELIRFDNRLDVENLPWNWGLKWEWQKPRGVLNVPEELRWDGVIVNFMCQLYWARTCSDIWLNIILDISVRVFLDEIALSNVVELIQFTEGLNRIKAWGRKNSFSLPIFGLGYRSPAFRLRLILELTPTALMIVRPLDLDWNCTISFPGVSSLRTDLADLKTSQPP